jgi:hypothetical protein
MLKVLKLNSMRSPLRLQISAKTLIFIAVFTVLFLGGGIAPHDDLSAQPIPLDLDLNQTEATSKPILLAQARRRPRSSRSKNSKKTSATQNQVVELKQLSFEGTIQRPSAAYLLQRRKLKFKGVEPKKSFLPQIFKSVERSPF